MYSEHGSNFYSLNMPLLPLLPSLSLTDTDLALLTPLGALPSPSWSGHSTITMAT